MPALYVNPPYYPLHPLLLPSYPILPPSLPCPIKPAIYRISRSASTSPVFATASLLSLLSLSSSSILFLRLASSSSPPHPQTSNASISNRSCQFCPSPDSIFVIDVAVAEELTRRSRLVVDVGEGRTGETRELPRLRRRAAGPLAAVEYGSAGIGEGVVRGLGGRVRAGLTLG